MLSVNVDKGVLEERLSKFEGRHFRLLNRLAVSRLEKGIFTPNDLKETNRELKKYFGKSDENGKYPLVEGVSSAMYSGINHSIEDTRINNGNLGLVIENDNVKTNYNLNEVSNFMKYAGMMGSEVFGKRFYFFPTTIFNSGVARGADIRSSGVARGAEIKGSYVALEADIGGSDVAEGAKMTSSYVAEGAKILFSGVAEGAEIVDSEVAREADIKGSEVARGADIKGSEVACKAKMGFSDVACEAKILNSWVVCDARISGLSGVAKEAEIKTSNVGMGARMLSAKVAEGAEIVDSVVYGRLN